MGPKSNDSYSDQNKHHKRPIDKTVISLYKLNSVLIALLLRIMAHFSIGKIGNDLNTVESAVVHYKVGVFYKILYDAVKRKWPNDGDSPASFAAIFKNQ